MRRRLALVVWLLATPVTAAGVGEAERAFAAAAQRDGQWTAFRAAATADALMFVPGPVAAQTWLAGRPDPAQAVQWWPTASVSACDGSLALSTGGAVWPGNKGGVFTTIWQSGKGRWRWVADWGADPPPAPDPGEVAARQASCSNLDNADAVFAALDAGALATISRQGSSADGSMRWRLRQGSIDGAFDVEVWAWDGTGFEPIATLTHPP